MSLAVEIDSQSSESLERSLALICRNLFHEPSALLRVGRYELIRTLGSGGMGVVYEALDSERGQRVALKMLKRQGANQIYRLKREFRALAEIRHSNLVALYELNVDEAGAYFTMELVSGRDIVSYAEQLTHVGADAAEHMRGRLAELAEAIFALHDAGKLHCDLKPSNVRVSDAGRVVVLDFGLARGTRERGGEIEGTPAYMAPECFEGRPCESSDWYSFGLIMRQVLRVLTRSEGYETWSEGVADLTQLASLLVAPEPSARPAAHDVLAILRGAENAPATLPGSGSFDPGFVGRLGELATLQEAFTRSRRGPVLVWVRGASGAGKTALMREAARRMQMKSNALVLSGNCYEREFIAYKAFDGVIDDLSRHLMCAGAPSLDVIPAPRQQALFHLFPVLGRVAPATQSKRHTELLDLPSARYLAFSGLKALLRAVAAERPLVLCLDNVQWSDSDSAALLSALCSGDDAPPMLMIGCDRSLDGSLPEALTDVAGSNTRSGAAAREFALQLEPLSTVESFELVTRLLRRTGIDGKSLRRIARAARGSPLLLTELSHWIATKREGYPAAGLSAAPSIDAMVAARMQALPEPARSALALIALAGRPLSADVAARALGLEQAELTVFEPLKRSRLIHAMRRGDEELLEVVHDRIGAAVLLRLDVALRKELHARLAQALDAEGQVSPEASLAQYLAAGLSEQAAHGARRAGELALCALAFSRAAWLFEQALALGRWSEPVRARLYRDLSLAFEHAGRGLEAAEAYRQAGRLSRELSESVALEAQAAEHLINNGRTAEGLEVLERCYRRLGLRWPRSRTALALHTLKLVIALYLRRTAPAATGERMPRHTARTRLLTLVGTTLEGIDPLRTAYNALLMVHEAGDSPEPALRIRAQGLRGYLRSMSPFSADAAAGLSELEAARKAAEELGDLSACGDLWRQVASARYHLEQPQAALEAIAHAERTLRTFPLAPRDFARVVGVVSCVLWELGELHQLEARFHEACQEAHHLSDAMNNFWIHAHPARFLLLLARDDRAGAERMIHKLSQLCARHPEHGLLRWTHAACVGEGALHWQSGAAALELVDAHWPALAGGGYQRFDLLARALRGRAYLAAALEEPNQRARRRLLLRARATARTLCWWERGPFARTAAATLDAGDALLSERSPDEVLSHLRRASVLLGSQRHRLIAACVGYAQGTLIAGEGGARLRAEAEQQLSAQGVRDVPRWVGWTLPAFRARMGAHAA